jgi:enoyl-CoA hydratase/carnithine racemase
MNNPAITHVQQGPVVVLTLNRPEERNLISGELTAALIESCRVINEDLAVKCVILTATGGIFCAGGNLKAMYKREHHFSGSAAEIRRYYENGIQKLARAFQDIEVPCIAAVNGAAIGAGLDIALMCDIRICAEEAVFAESFIRLGLVSAAGGSWLLQRVVGRAMAAEMTLTGDNIDAQRAREAGIVSQVLPQVQLLPRAHEIAARIARHPSHSIRLNKRLLRESAELSLDASLTLAASLQGIAQHTEDYAEAVAAVVEKREPVFTNK